MRFSLFLLLLIPLATQAANPAFTDFNTNQFGTNGNKVQIKSGASITNAALTTPSLGAATALTLDTGQGANELFDMDQNVLTTSSPVFGGTTLSPNGLLNIVWTNLATTQLAGLTLSNATPATAGVTVQASPAMYWVGRAWDTDDLVERVIIFRVYNTPGSASTPTGSLIFDRSLDGGATFSNPVTYNASGTLQSVNFTATALITAGSTSSLVIAGRSRLASSVNGAFEANNNADSARSTIQFNLPQTTKTANYTNAVALDSGMRFVNIGAGGAITNFLPTAVALQQYYFYVDAAQIYSIKAAGTDVIRDAATSSGAGMDIWSNAIGSTLHLFCPKAGFWVVQSKNGAWTNNP